ncbi:sulfate ABC transporter substrate-binding protein [Leptospira sp. GIMC2001]|uniref:sulfate ABC transporter substrate-binding protein n=1 Tax=Leptospira sp. GIMC2001 TaxID=1513297 RepID=UPI003FA578E3
MPHNPLRFTRVFSFAIVLAVFIGHSFIHCKGSSEEKIDFLNVSFDPTREMYEEINREFEKEWNQKSTKRINFQQSHGGSGKQARGVIDGLKADVVTLALSYDIDSIAERSGFIDKDWANSYPNHSTPYYSTIVLLVRAGNPKQIFDWNDVVRDSISVITPNPKTSGGARWNYLAAWAYAKNIYKDREEDKIRFIQALYKNTSVLDAGARGSTSTFVQRGIGDVLLAWENEALLAIEESKRKNGGQAKFEIVYPSISILAETPVAAVNKINEKKGTTEVAADYIKFIYSKQGQEIAAKHFFRPFDNEILKLYSTIFKPIKLVNIRDLEGSWKDAQKKHFAEGGIFDQIYSDKKF